MKVMGKEIDELKDAIIAEMASDVLKIKEDVEVLAPLVNQLKDSFPELFDILKAGMIETLDEINNGLKDAGGERIEFVKGQLHVFIEQAIGQAFSENKTKAEHLIALFEKQNKSATSNLKQQYDEVSEGMSQIQKEIQKTRFPLWLKVIIPLGFIVAIAASTAITWQIASYKEAMYMRVYMENMKNEPPNP